MQGSKPCHGNLGQAGDRAAQPSISASCAFTNNSGVHLQQAQTALWRNLVWQSSVCTEEGFFSVKWAFLFQITKSVLLVSFHTHLLISSLAGDASVSLTNFPAQQAQPLQCFQQAAHCSSVSCHGQLPPGSPHTWTLLPPHSKLQL